MYDLAESILAPRACGDCNACCIELDIPAGQVSTQPKPAGTVCPLLCSSGCSAYEERPSSCSEFRCAWLRDSKWPDAWRPDQSGLVCQREMIAGVGPVGTMLEIMSDALDTTEAGTMLETLRRSTVAVIVVDYLRRRQTHPGYLRFDTGSSASPSAMTVRSTTHSLS